MNNSRSIASSGFPDLGLAGPGRRGKRGPSAANARGPAPRTPLNGLRILIVEDDPASAKLLDVILRGEGCVTSIARSAEEAVVVLRAFRPSVIVLDLVLPLMSGLLFARTVKAAPATRDVVIIAVSALNGPKLERSALAAGCTGYLRKPIDPLTFTALLERHLGGAA